MSHAQDEMGSSNGPRGVKYCMSVTITIGLKFKIGAYFTELSLGVTGVRSHKAMLVAIAAAILQQIIVEAVYAMKGLRTGRSRRSSLARGVTTGLQIPPSRIVCSRKRPCTLQEGLGRARSIALGLITTRMSSHRGGAYG